VGPNHKSRGLKGQPTDHTLSRLEPGLGGYVHTLVQKRILCPRAGGNQEEWPASHVDGHPAIHHLQTDLIKSVEAPLYPNIRIPMVEFTDTTPFL
jgi:hypothetical protein